MIRSKDQKSQSVNLAVSFFLFFQILISQNIYSQEKDAHTNGSSVANVISLYHKSLGEQAGLYNGPEYTGYAVPILEGHPYFQTDHADQGSIFYDGLLYENVPIWYDLVKNEIVVLHFDHTSKIRLHNEKIKYFSIYNHTFINLGLDSSIVSDIPPGFYDLAYDGESEVLVKRTKYAKLEPMWITILNQKNDIYLKKEGKYYPVKNEDSVLKALGSRQKEIQLYLKNNKVKFRKDPEETVITMVDYYEQLKRKP
jgi:hypothetical protein